MLNESLIGNSQAQDRYIESENPGLVWLTTDEINSMHQSNLNLSIQNDEEDFPVDLEDNRRNDPSMLSYDIDIYGLNNNNSSMYETGRTQTIRNSNNFSSDGDSLDESSNSGENQVSLAFRSSQISQEEGLNIDSGEEADQSDDQSSHEDEEEKIQTQLEERRDRLNRYSLDYDLSMDDVVNRRNGQVMTEEERERQEDLRVQRLANEHQ